MRRVAPDSRIGSALTDTTGRQRLLLLTGIPATGKTEMGRFLEREHGFVHVEMEGLIQTPPPKAGADLLRIAKQHKLSGKEERHSPSFEAQLPAATDDLRNDIDTAGVIR